MVYDGLIGKHPWTKEQKAHLSMVRTGKKYPRLKSTTLVVGASYC